MAKKSWTEYDLQQAVRQATSVRSTIRFLKLVPAGGNYVQIAAAIKRLGIDTSHFTGKGWLRGRRRPYAGWNERPLEDLLKNNVVVQSFKLKKRLFKEGLKEKKCELCNWAQVSVDGRTPLELDHINGNPQDNRLSNLRVLCPNCHSLQPTHRGRNKKVRYAH